MRKNKTRKGIALVLTAGMIFVCSGTPALAEEIQAQSAETVVSSSTEAATQTEATAQTGAAVQTEVQTEAAVQEPAAASTEAQEPAKAPAGTVTSTAETEAPTAETEEKGSETQEPAAEPARTAVETEAETEAETEKAAAETEEKASESEKAAETETETEAETKSETETETEAQTETRRSGSTGSYHSSSSSSSGGYTAGSATYGDTDSSLEKRIYNIILFAEREQNEDYGLQEFDQYIFIGDSRTVGMQMSVPADEEDVWSCKESMGYNWMVSTGVPAVEQEITDKTAVFILLGINDLGNVNSYVSYINDKAMEWEAKGATTFFVAIGPVGQTTVTNAQIESFNSVVQSNIVCPYIDLYTEMLQNGFSTQDGLHYTTSTYEFIYSYLKEQAAVLAVLN